MRGGLGEASLGTGVLCGCSVWGTEGPKVPISFPFPRRPVLLPREVGLYYRVRPGVPAVFAQALTRVRVPVTERPGQGLLSQDCVLPARPQPACSASLGTTG